MTLEIGVKEIKGIKDDDEELDDLPPLEGDEEKVKKEKD